MVDFQLLVKSFYGYEYFRDIFDHRRKGPWKHQRFKKDDIAAKTQNMKWKSSQLFSLCASKQETTSTTRQFGKLTKSHRKLRTNWNVENLKPSVVVASCGVWGWGAGSGNGRNERFCTPDHLYNTINFSCLHNAGKSLQTTPAPCSMCTSFCSLVYCWLGLP